MIRKIKVLFSFVFLILFSGCSRLSSEVKGSVKDYSVLNKKFIKGITTKQDVLNFFGEKPHLILSKEALSYTEEGKLGYYEKWSYIIQDRTSFSKLIDFFGGEVIGKLIGTDLGKTEGYCIGLFFDEKGYLQDYKIYW